MAKQTAPAAASSSAPAPSSTGRKKPHLSGRQKAAVFLVTLGSELSAEVFKHLREDEIEALTFEIARLETFDKEQ